MKLELIAFSQRGEQLARRAAQLLGQAGHTAACTRDGMGARDWAGRAFVRAEGLIFVGAAGIAVRSIAPWLRRKSTDPAVVVMDETGQYAIPILSGHLGGANDLARELERLLGCKAVITTATDCNGIFSPDQWARTQGLAVINPQAILSLSARLLAGETVRVWSRWPIPGPPPQGLVPAQRERAELVVDLYRPDSPALYLCPPCVRLGLGCRRGASPAEIEALALQVLEEEGIPLQAVGAVCTIDRKGDEEGLLAFCRTHRLPLRLYTPRQLEEVSGQFTPSPFVKAVTGVDNVCERACCAGGGALLRGKTARQGVTAALALEEPGLSWRWLS